jgi:hypothetical protein
VGGEEELEEKRVRARILRSSSVKEERRRFFCGMKMGDETGRALLEVSEEGKEVEVEAEREDEAITERMEVELRAETEVEESTDEEEKVAVLAREE